MSLLSMSREVLAPVTTDSQLMILRKAGLNAVSRDMKGSWILPDIVESPNQPFLKPDLPLDFMLLVIIVYIIT